jgi:hypothetical protein
MRIVTQVPSGNTFSFVGTRLDSDASAEWEHV